MFGISFSEFLLILVLAMLIIPVKDWGGVIKFLAKIVSTVRNLIWKITDFSEDIKQQIEMEQPINDLINKTTDELLDEFSHKVKKKKK